MFAAAANAVVIPHVGHGLPIVKIQLHWAIPICVCVPTPLSDGRSDAATTSTARTPAAKTAAAIRSPREARAGPRNVGGVVAESVTGKG